MKPVFPIKSLSMKIFTTVLTLVLLVGTSSLVAVLTQQKALEAAQASQFSEQLPLIDDELLPEIFKTDRFIVKYKENKANSFKSKLSYELLESRSLDSVKNSLENASVLPESIGDSRSASSRYADMEVLVLSEKVEPAEFEEALIASGAYNDILYIQSDYELEIASVDINIPIADTLGTNLTLPPIVAPISKLVIV